MLRVCHEKPFMPHRPVKGIEAELAWWTARLQQGEVICPIKPPTQFFDSLVFSDASSGVGIGIIIQVASLETPPKLAIHVGRSA